MTQQRRARTQPSRRPATSSRRRSTGGSGAAPRGTTRARASGGNGRLRRLAGGDRPYLAALVVLVVLVVTMALGPLQNYTAAADRVDSLETSRDQLRQQVDALEDRRTRLSDPEELELIARSELGMVMPGEVPFVVVTPNDDEVEQVRPEPPETLPSGDAPWYRKLGRTLQDLFTVDS
jgi:cell division protein FtsB